MDQRKIIGLGRSSLVISLPQDWAELNELKRGDVVSLAIQRDRSLVIFPGNVKKETSRETVINTKPEEKSIMIIQRIIASYLNGFSSIKLVSEKPFTVDQRKAIRYISRRLYLRIMESDTKSMQMMAFIDESQASVMSGVRRMHTITSSMCRDVISSLRDDDEAIAKAVYSLDEDVDHFAYLILRLVRKVCLEPALANQLELDPIDALDTQSLVHRMEEVADNAANIAKQLISLHRETLEIPELIKELMLAAGKYAIDSYSKAVETFFSQDTSSYAEIIDYQKNAGRLNRDMRACAFLSSKSDPFLSVAMCSIGESIKRIAEYATNIAEIAILRFHKPEQ